MTQLTSLLMYSLYAPTWTARKLDKKVTAQAKEANGVDDDVDAGNFNKLILPACLTLTSCQKYIGATRLQFYQRTAPWGEARGIRVGKAEEHLDTMMWFGDRQAGLVPLVDALCEEYPQLVAKMEYELHGMFNPEDYPPVEVVRSRFALKLSVSPLPNINDVRVLTEIPAHVRQEIEDSLHAEFAKVQQDAVTNAFTALLKPVAHMSRQLKAYQDGNTRKIFESVISNVIEMSGAAKRLNVTRDPEIDRLADEAAAMVDGVTKKDLKESDGFRVTTQKKAEDLAARIAAFLP